MSSIKRQKEIKLTVDKIAAFKPNQILIEYDVTKQHKMDSIYHEFLNGKYELEDDEIDQLGFKSAKKLGLAKLICVRHSGKFDSDTVMSYAQQNQQGYIVEEFGQFAENFAGEVDKKLKEKSLIDFLIYINSDIVLNKNASLYTKYFVKIGKEENYVGTNLVSDWYNTNLHVYTNILRSISPDDKSILVIYGQGHIPILKHLFETNPDFEVVSIEQLLK